MKLPESVRRQFRAHGKRGGLERARRMSPEARRAVARLAAVRRWVRERYGRSSFESLGLPGGDLIDAGLADLVSGRVTIESLLVSLASPRLRREGVPVPAGVLADADLRLYRLLEEDNPGLAHARYLAYLRQASSFADSCRHSRLHRGSDAA